MLIHKFHLALGPGQQLVLADSGHPLFICQGHWDSGGALHCVAVAFALLGRLTEPVTLSRSDTGPEATFWDHAWPHYPHGLTPSELESFIWELSLGVRPVALHGSGGSTLSVCERELTRGPHHRRLASPPHSRCTRRACCRHRGSAAQASLRTHRPIAARSGWSRTKARCLQLAIGLRS